MKNVTENGYGGDKSKKNKKNNVEIGGEISSRACYVHQSPATGTDGMSGFGWPSRIGAFSAMGDDQTADRSAVWMSPIVNASIHLIY